MKKEEREIESSRCGVCDFRIAEIEQEQARFDYLCPRCGKRNLSFFLPVFKPRQESKQHG